MSQEGRFTINSGKDDDGRIYAAIIRNGREWKRVVSDGFAPFKSEKDARTYARRVIQRGV